MSGKQMIEKQMTNKVAVITGGTSGIGFACACRFAEEGAKLVLADLFEDKGAESVARLQADYGAEAIFVQTDVTSESAVEALGAATLAKFGRVDSVVAAAGIASGSVTPGAVVDPNADPEAGHVINKPLSNWLKVLEVNLTGVMLTNKVMARLMIEGGVKGTIVNIASVAARRPLVGAADYCVSKAGVEMLTKVLSLELMPHEIRVNSIGPGFVETPMTANLRSDNEGNMMAMSMTPMARYGKPAEIANTALFLSTDASSYYAGQILFPAGGMFTS
jgi:NAD(P)-dependent dehydrogenase (short-subunit alcohol dehydrogenase family)